MWWFKKYFNSIWHSVAPQHIPYFATGVSRLICRYEKRVVKSNNSHYPHLTRALDMLIIFNFNPFASSEFFAPFFIIFRLTLFSRWLLSSIFPMGFINKIIVEFFSECFMTFAHDIKFLVELNILAGKNRIKVFSPDEISHFYVQRVVALCRRDEKTVQYHWTASVENKWEYYFPRACKLLLSTSKSVN